MTNIEQVTEIDASVETVYNIIMDFDKYPDWNPFVVNISGNPKVGEYINATITIDGESKQESHLEILANEENKELRWVAKLFSDWIMRGEHYFLIKPNETDENKCSFYHGEHFTGIIIPLINFMMGEKLKSAFEKYNYALKTRAESM